MNSKKLFSFAAVMSLSVTTVPFIADSVQAAGNEKQAINNPQMQLISRYDSGVKNEDGGSTEIVAYNPDNEKIYVINGTTKKIEVIPANGFKENEKQISTLQAQSSIDVEAILKQHNPSFEYGDLTSISINTKQKLIAAAVQAKGYNDDGLAVLLSYDGKLVKVVSAGKQPDMITFSPDGSKIVIANEGEPREGYGIEAVDPMGSVTIVDLSSGVDKAVSENITFESYDSKRRRFP